MKPPPIMDLLPLKPSVILEIPAASYLLNNRSIFSLHFLNHQFYFGLGGRGEIKIKISVVFRSAISGKICQAEIPFSQL